MTDSPQNRKPAAEVRERLIALILGPRGPRAGHSLAGGRLPGWIRPSNWYLTGFREVRMCFCTPSPTC